MIKMTLSSHLDPNTDRLSADCLRCDDPHGNRHARFKELPM
jgi:hypothetical protein